VAAKDDVQRVKKTVSEIFVRRKAAVYALCLAYAGYAIRRFRARQPAVPNSAGRYWVNRTAQAAERMNTRAFKRGNVLGFRMSHGVEYGVYLELANNRRNQAIEPIVMAFGEQFYKALYGLYVTGNIPQGETQ